MSVRLRIENLPFQEGLVSHHRIDRENGDTHAAWQAMGAPEAPSVEQLADLRAVHEFAALAQPEPFSQGPAAISIDLPAPAVHLVLLSRKPPRPPAAPRRVFARRFAGMHEGRRDVLVRWDAGSRFARTHEVLYAAAEQGPYERVNAAPMLGTAHVASVREPATGFIKVRTVDLWGRVGAASPPILIGDEPAPAAIVKHGFQGPITPR